MKTGDVVKWKIAEGKGYSGEGEILNGSKRRSNEELYDNQGKRNNLLEYKECDVNEAERIFIKTQNGFRLLNREDIL